MRSGLGDWVYRRGRRTDRSLVADDRPHLIRVAVGELLAFVATVAALAGLSLLDPGWLRVLCSVLVGFQVGRSGLLAMRRANAYRSGWLEGRSMMIAAMAEAMRRGMTLSDWVAGEAMRDAATLGVDPEEIAATVRRATEGEGEQ